MNRLDPQTNSSQIKEEFRVRVWEDMCVIVSVCVCVCLGVSDPLLSPRP